MEIKLAVFANMEEIQKRRRNMKLSKKIEKLGKTSVGQTL